MREFFRRHPILPGAVAASVAVACLLWVFFVIGRPLPPRHVVMTTGPDGGAFREYGERYRAALAKDGIDLKLVPSLGSVENLKRLKDPASGVSAGFVSGGLTNAKDSPGTPVPRDDLVRSSVDLLPGPSRARPDERPARQARVDRPRRQRHARHGARAAPRERHGGRVHGPAAHAGRRRRGAPQRRDRLRLHADRRRRADRQEAARRRARRASRRSRGRTRTSRSIRT